MERMLLRVALATVCVMGAVALFATDTGAQVPLSSLSYVTTDAGPRLTVPPPKFGERVILCPNSRTALIQNNDVSPVRLGPAGNTTGLTSAPKGFRLASGSAVNWDVSNGTVAASTEVNSDAGVILDVLCGSGPTR